MNPGRFLATSLSLCVLAAVSQTEIASAADDYTLGPDSMPQSGVPRGRIESFTFNDSKIFPGTERDCWLYVPAQYDASQPACLMVFQDGSGMVGTNGSYRVPIVFDNLIAKKEMPVTLAVFINPGTFPATEQGQRGRSNRSFEYDSLGDLYARFLLEEFLPPIEAKYNITKDPAGRAICGNSSGGICAFTVAWERPGAFQKVVSHIGSFTNIRGGYVYPALIRRNPSAAQAEGRGRAGGRGRGRGPALTDEEREKIELRGKIRVFLQDGSNDLDNLHGNWPLANQDMAAALEFAGWDHKFVFGDGGHNGKHGGSIFPDTMRWLWRDYPK